MTEEQALELAEMVIKNDCEIAINYGEGSYTKMDAIDTMLEEGQRVSDIIRCAINGDLTTNEDLVDSLIHFAAKDILKIKTENNFMELK